MTRRFEPLQLGSIELFCQAAELGSFTAAAEALGVTPGGVSRAVGRLEARLGVRLFVRSTRRIALTPEGERYHAQCRQALEQIAEAEREASGGQAAPSGRLRISVPTTYAHHRLLPLLPGFSAAYPGVALELHIDNHNIDFVADGFDLAIRLGTPQDSRLIARPLEDATLGLFASPDYLRRHGTPRTRADLDAHARIQFVRPSTGRPMPWLLKDEAGGETPTLFDSPRQVHGDVLGCVGWARAGGGLVQIYHFIAADDVARGTLVEVLPALAGATRRFSILYPHNRHLSARVRVFVDHLVAAVRGDAPLSAAPGPKPAPAPARPAPSPTPSPRGRPRRGAAAASSPPPAPAASARRR